MDMRIRDLPDELHRDLKVAAAMDRMTLNKLIVQLLQAAMDKRNRSK